MAKSKSTALASLYGGKVARARKEGGKALAGNVSGQEREQTVLTPPWLLNELRSWATADYGRSATYIALDPCTTAENPTGAAHFFTEKDNGLEKSWGVWDWVEESGFVFVNPPYADLRVWLEKCSYEAHRSTLRPMPIYALVPWRSNREWFCAAIEEGGATATTIAPIAFVGSKSGFPAPLCILSWNLPVPQMIACPAARGGSREIVTGIFQSTRRWDY